jgi:hypothetical protein
LEFLTRAIRQGEEIKGIQIRKEVIKFSLHADDMFFYLKVHKKKFLGAVNSFNNVVEYKINL